MAGSVWPLAATWLATRSIVCTIRGYPSRWGMTTVHPAAPFWGSPWPEPRAVGLQERRIVTWITFVIPGVK
jgi:hypothetical protein